MSGTLLWPCEGCHILGAYTVRHTRGSCRPALWELSARQNCWLGLTIALYWPNQLMNSYTSSHMLVYMHEDVNWEVVRGREETEVLLEHTHLEHSC